MRRLAAVVSAVGLAALAIRRYLSAREALAQVAPELRSPVLPFVTVEYTAKSLPVLRALYRIKTPAGSGVSVVTRHVGAPAVRVLVTTPDAPGGLRPAVLAIHAGGMVVGSPQIELASHGQFARALGAVVVSPDYRLAPEHPFPAGLDDCMTTLRWMRANADELGIDPQRIAVVGASAGGGLAAAVAQRSHDEGIALRAQGLVYAMIDDRTALTADHQGRGRLVWTPESNRFGWRSYLGRAPRMSDAPQYAAPARRQDLSGLPPAWIGVGELDLYYVEDVAYGQRLRACGVPCELVTVPKMYHAADGYAAKAPVAQQFTQSLVNHLRTYL